MVRRTAALVISVAMVTLFAGLAAGCSRGEPVSRADPRADVAPPAPATPGADILQPGAEVADQTFIDQDGVARRLSDFRGHAVALTFIYTGCTTGEFCPAMDRNFAVVQRTAAGDPRVKDRIRLVSVSFDPEHDTPAVLKTHASRLQADPAVWAFLTGNRDDIERFASRFGLSILRDAGDASEIPHNLRTAVIDPQGRLVKIYSGFDWTPDQLIADLARATAG